jgi:hypothetical protein
MTTGATPTTPPTEPAPRRWHRDLRAQLRWFTAEILVVVAGVLIALALNAWWQGRQQAREEQRLLVALLDEFTANQDRLAGILAFHSDLKATAQVLLALSADPSPTLSVDSADQLLADVTWWASYTTLESTVLDAAVQDGQLDLIRTDSLRRLLSTWRSEVGSAVAQSNQEFAHYANAWLPLLRAESDIAQFADKAKLIPGSNVPYQGAPIPQRMERTDHRPLIRSRTFRNAMVQKLWIEDDVLYQYGSLEPLLRRIIGALHNEVEVRHRP